MRYWTALYLALLLNACSTSVGIDPPAENVYDPVVFEAAFLEIERTPGDQRLSLFNGFNATQFMLHVPADTSAPRPLIIALHWSGSDTAVEDYFDCLAVPGLDTLDAYIIAPRDTEGNWLTTINLFNISELRALALRHWPVDPDRIAVTGYGLGGIGSYQLADKYGELFSAVIPMAGAYPPEERLTVPAYVIHGTLDNVFLVNFAREEVRAARALGSDIRLVEAEGLGHGLPCAYLDYFKAAAVWLEEEVW